MALSIKVNGRTTFITVKALNAGTRILWSTPANSWKEKRRGKASLSLTTVTFMKVNLTIIYSMELASFIRQKIIHSMRANS
jgi:hypothetical protein